MQQYPLELTFKFFSLSPQITINNGQGQTIMHVQQRLFKLKELIHVFADTARTQEIYNIKADRIIDFSARYNFADDAGRAIGAVKRKGMKSLWKAHYDIFDGEEIVFTIEEENPWIKVIDALLSEIPIVGMFTGYFFNPEYIVARPDGREVMRLAKIPSFLSRIFTIKAKDELSAKEEPQVLLSLMMLLLLERNRG
ncbi:hypothetical protein IQ266_22115 [filamentous cyanobacterium LEGE 11480]|uniref:Uncharacterized protein n=1 Tax=Romeriopsis navalis LEGE 11480 TaxID=2777977 RepID=A0A928VTU6_9CYAN|nr:hypothetical protein [Romeriopsis navalis]MBE9032437.1 hypothetical protein [Romeriopsis navalis LEGE 11480]